MVKVPEVCVTSYLEFTINQFQATKYNCGYAVSNDKLRNKDF